MAKAHRNSLERAAMLQARKLRQMARGGFGLPQKASYGKATRHGAALKRRQ